MDEVDDHIPAPKAILFQVQCAAPKPKKVICDRKVTNNFPQYGAEYHGAVSEQQAAKLLTADGSYLVRESRSRPGQVALVIRYKETLQHFMLYYDPLLKKHYVKEDKFDSLNDLVQDGLICFHMERHAPEIIESIVNARRASKPRPSVYDYLKDRTSQTLKRKLAIVDTSEPDIEIEPKAHNFKTTTFVGFHWCDFCSHFLWGLVNQGVRCQDCGRNAHTSCSKKIPPDCVPSLKYLKQVFGQDISVLCLAEDSIIPNVVKMCVTEIEKRGLKEEGIYRTAGFKDHVDALRIQFDKEKDVTRIDLSANACPDINTVASLLKLYFRLLPVPLVEFNCLHQLMVIYNNPDLSEMKRLQAALQHVRTLPWQHYNTLKYFTGHLARITENESENKMSVDALTTCVAPSLMCSEEDDTNPLKRLTNLKLYAMILNDLVDRHKFFFTAPRLSTGGSSTA